MTTSQIDWQHLKQYLAPRPNNTHKGDFGHSLLVGGDHGYVGAIILAGVAALKVGSGLTSIATQPDYAKPIPLGYPEIMAHGVTGKSDLAPLLEKATVVGIGPGLGCETWGQRLLFACLEADLPCVIDADALNLLSDETIKSDQWILTPHPGEAAKLLGITVQQVQNNRPAAITEIQQKYGGTVVLKGHHTLITDGKEIFQCQTGNPGMSSGGMGDLLTGAITGLLAQAIPALAAAQIGAYVHGKAGDLAAEKDGQRGLSATDLISHLHHLVNPDV